MNYGQLFFAAHLLDPMDDQKQVYISRKTLSHIPEPDVSRLLQYFFGNASEKYLSRRDVFKQNRRRNMELSMLSTLFWGYPSNQRGICRSAFNSWNELTVWFHYISQNQEMSLQQFIEMIPRMQNIHGLGVSTLSKFLYFSGCQIGGHRCLILDDQVVKGVSLLRGEEFETLKSAITNNRHRLYRNYPGYLEEMDSLALQMGVSSAERLEYVLWLAAKRNI